MHKLEDEETGLLYPTNVACKLLDRRNGRCLDYKHRKKRVADCVKLDRKNLDSLDWLPETCAYRLRAAGKPLPDWHYLISGSRETVHEAGQSTRGWTVSEEDAGELECHVVDRAALKPRWHAGLPVPIEIRPMRSARRLRLRFDEARGVLKLTCPLRTSRRAALAWALDQRDWIEAQLARAVPAEPFAPGAVIPIEGRDTRLVWVERRAADAAPGRRRAALRRAARRRSPRRIEAVPQAAARSTPCRARPPNSPQRPASTSRSVSVGDAGTRWGSCSSQGRIRSAGG